MKKPIRIALVVAFVASLPLFSCDLIEYACGRGPNVFPLALAAIGLGILVGIITLPSDA
jgi:hypothetical protein